MHAITEDDSTEAGLRSGVIVALITLKKKIQARAISFEYFPKGCSGW